MAIDHALMEHLAHLAHPVIHIDFGAASAQRRFAAHRDAMRALSAMQTPILKRAHLVRIAASKHLVHEPRIVTRSVARVDACEPVPVLSKDLFEDVPGRQGFCSHQAASLSGVRLCVIARFYHILSTTSTPVLSLLSGTAPHAPLPGAMGP
jgi:hypothetical protein